MGIKMIGHLRELNSRRELLWMWSQREIRIRYKQSVLGVAWAVLQPLVLMIMFTVVFSVFVRVPTDGIPYPLFSYTALLPWTLFSTALTFAVPSLVNNMNLVTKIYFPREILPMASVAAAFVDFLVASIVFLGLMIFYQIPLRSTMLWVPFVLGIQIVLVLGVVLTAAPISVRYRDIRFVVPLGIQLWMYASPVIYPVTLVPEQWRTLYMLNPMAGLITSYRNVILLGLPPPIQYLSLSAIVAILWLVFGYWYFKRSEPRFADVI
jgi:lipopolysaccharide transport system permease protein